MEAQSAELRAAPAGWLERSLIELQGLWEELSAARNSDEVFRLAVAYGRERLGFRRLSVWRFSGGFHCLRGTYGVNELDEIVDERDIRIFDQGSVTPYRDAWSKPPYYYLNTKDPLRDSDGRVIGEGVHFIAPVNLGDPLGGFLSIDDLLESEGVNGKTGALVGVFANIIGSAYQVRKANEKMAKAIDDKEKANAKKQEFLGMLSHEVRTPLNAILGFSQIICEESRSPEQANLAKTIEESGDHLLNLLTGMMEYAQLGNEDLKERFKACDAVRLLRDTVDVHVETAKRKGIGLSFEHAGDLEGEVLADSTGLRQILTNLLQNAIKFTREGEIRVVLQTQPKPSGKVALQLSVEDTGVGIPEHEIESIFEPFHQVDTTMTRGHGGIGMGLAIVERLARAMGGDMSCQSQVGAGSRFVVHFDFEYAGAAPLVTRHEIGTRSAAGKDRSHLKLLLAEDSATNRALLLRMLERAGFPRPEVASDGNEARQLLCQRPFDLFLADLHMPGVDGVTLTRLVREGKCGTINADVPIVALTAYHFEFDRHRAIAAGVDRYLVKPCKMETLEEAIEELVRSE